MLNNRYTPEEKSLLMEIAKSGRVDYTELENLYPELFRRHTKESIKFMIKNLRKEIYASEYQKERQKLLLNKGTTEFKNIVKITATQDRILEFLEEKLPKLKIKIPKVEFKETHKSTESFVMNIADFHIGEVINKDEMMGLNEYNLKIMEKRFNFYIRTVLNIRNKLNYNFDELVIFFLGDIYSGDIHEELSITNEANIVDCFFSSVNMFFSAIVYLLNFFPKIRVEGVVGNHTRMKKSIYYKQKYVNWDYILYKTLEMMAKKAGIKNIEFNFPKSPFLLTKIKNSNFLLLHGSDIRSWASIPWYGIERASAKLMDILGSQRKYFDYMILAHFHTNSSIDKAKGEKIICGSLSGVNEFSLYRTFTGTRPRQLIFGVHKDEGVTWRYPINLDRCPKNIEILFKFGYE